MNREYIKKRVIDNINIMHKFLYRGSRNQNDIFEGKITKCYHSIFLIELNDGTVKSFSYNDFGINNIKIIS